MELFSQKIKDKQRDSMSSTNKFFSFIKYHLMYHTKRHTQVNSFTVGFIYRLAQIIIIFYIVVYGKRIFERIAKKILKILKF